ncbi:MULTISPECIES: Na/Pi cotransporter family protein [Clostridiaceae]|uniref:Na/Pi cotransporter family protein n=1 Tax=Clostridium facile TaxID=2763035 RepID=A0ABR7IQD0_9CLOT|nr:MULTISPECIES: Na/Pi cotransporter family protein [Clostridiaceae]MBC5787278.1 Na/Pi cotransporter family protein [Clostridium facile]
MKITDIFSLLGGLALFLYGMQMMSNGLEAAAGNKMKKILEKLTSNRFLGVLVGAGITAVIQSSSATTVMVVGFVNSGMMTLSQAVWIIMGANIGTTITGQLIALDIGAIAPLFAFVGVALIVFIKKQKVHYYGLIVAGLGTLFIGMEMMSSAMMPLRESDAFISLMTKFSNPVLGILAGMIFTAIIQSSSASVGILQALAVSGLIGLPNAVFVLFGQNIGTCITAVLASIGTNRSAKRTTIIHLLFNLIGTTIFTIVCIATPLTSWVESLTPDNVAAQIANMHTIFNIVTTILLLPFGTYLAKLATKILPDKQEEHDDVMHLEFIRPVVARGEHQIGLSAIALTNIKQELRRMMEMVKHNVDNGFDAVQQRDLKLVEKVQEREDYIDYLNKEISKYISKIMVEESNPRDSQYISALFKVCGNLERIGDHAMNICEYTKMIHDKKIHFSPEELSEMAEMKKVSIEALDCLENLKKNAPEEVQRIADLEQQMDDMTESYRTNQTKRMQEGKCSDEACILYSEMLTDFERIGDHILNIGQEMGLGKVSA